MNVTTHKAIMVEVALTEDEARWLIGVMQNPLSAQPEDVDYQRMREMFFTHLTRALKEA